jgi:hypothetical protein
VVTRDRSRSGGRSRLEGVIKLLSLILKSDKWHTILLLVSFIKSLGVGKDWRQRRALWHGVVHGSHEASQVIV